MDINIIIATENGNDVKGTCVVFDVLRASSVECYLHFVGASKTIAESSLEHTYEMKKINKEYLLVGERDGIKCEGFDFGNSPSEILANKDKIKGKVVYHNTTAGTQAIAVCQKNKNVDEILISCPNNLQATLNYLLKEKPKLVTLVAAGNKEDCYEDYLICEYFKSLLLNKKPLHNIEKIKEVVKNTSGKKFFRGLKQYTPIDFDICFELNKINKYLKVINGEIFSFDDK